MDKEIYELEANLLGAMILEHKKFMKAQEEGLLPEDFETTSYKKAYEVMIQAQASDMVTIRNLIKDDFVFEDIREAAVYCITPAGFSHWIKAMHDKTANNKLVSNYLEKFEYLCTPELPSINTTEEKIDNVSAIKNLANNLEITGEEAIQIIKYFLGGLEQLSSLGDNP